MMESKICTGCEISKPIDHFISKAGKPGLKTCSNCRLLKHPMCKHNKRRSRCIICDGGELCIHNKRRRSCKNCSNAPEITISKMIRHSKEADIKKDLYDANNFIDYCFISSLVDESTKCYYCKVQMQFIEYNSTLCTIERLDNKIGHIKSNCVLACRTCNYSRVGQRKKRTPLKNNEPIEKVKPSLKCTVCTKKFKTFSKKTPFICSKCRA